MKIKKGIGLTASIENKVYSGSRLDFTIGKNVRDFPKKKVTIPNNRIPNSSGGQDFSEGIIAQIPGTIIVLSNKMDKVDITLEAGTFSPERDAFGNPIPMDITAYISPIFYENIGVSEPLFKTDWKYQGGKWDFKADQIRTSMANQIVDRSGTDSDIDLKISLKTYYQWSFWGKVRDKAIKELTIDESVAVHSRKGVPGQIPAEPCVWTIKNKVAESFLAGLIWRDWQTFIPIEKEIVSREETIDDVCK